MPDSTSYVTTTTEITHIGSGASIASGGFSGTADISTALVGTGNLAKYPRCDLVLVIGSLQAVVSQAADTGKLGQIA